jgi:hypothetical protein
MKNRFNYSVTLQAFAISLLIVLQSCGGNNGTTNCKESKKGVLKNLPSIACEYTSKLKKIEIEEKGLETKARGAMEKEDEAKLEKYMAEAEEMGKEIELLEEEGEKAIEAYIQSEELNIPGEADVNGEFDISKVYVDGGHIDPPNAVINFKADVTFNKKMKIGYKGDYKSYKLLAELLDGNGEVIKTQKIYRGFSMIGRDIKKGDKETLHLNPTAEGLGDLQKIVVKHLPKE